MRAEFQIFQKENQWNIENIKSLMKSTHNEKMCTAYEEHLRGLTDELNALFTTGTGRRTPEYQTMLNPHKK